MTDDVKKERLAEKGLDEEDKDEREGKEEASAAADAAEEVAKRKGIFKVELTIFYEDGWEQMMKCPPLFQVRQVPGSTPGMQAAAKYYNASEINKTVALLEGLIEDLKNTIPTKEEIEAAKKQAMEHEVEIARRASIMAAQQQMPVNPKTGRPLQFPPR